MKIAIYALTFLTYAYSGYGSSTIAHLRDAIIAAEAIFGDVFKNLITVLRKFHTVQEVFDAAVEEQCIYKCPTLEGGPGELKNFVIKLRKLNSAERDKSKKMSQFIIIVAIAKDFCFVCFYAGAAAASGENMSELLFCVVFG